MKKKVYLLALAAVMSIVSFISCSNGEGGRPKAPDGKVAGSMYSNSDEDTIHVLTDTAHISDN